MPDKKQIGGVNWELANDSAREWARRHSAQLVGGILDTTRDKIRRNVADFVENQRTFGELTANIQASGAFNQARANLIAVTETTGSYAEGNMVAWKESGVTEATMWNTNNDSLVCTICGPLDGVVVPLGSEFDGGGEGPPAHPGCRCWLTPRMLGDTETRADIDATYGLERMPGIGAPYENVLLPGDAPGGAIAWSTDLQNPHHVFEWDGDEWVTGSPGNWQDIPSEQILIDLDKNTGIGPKGGQAAGKWAEDAYEDWLSGLSPSERAAIADYTGPDYQKINGLLRHGRYPDYYSDELRQRLDEKAEQMTNALSRARLPNNTVLYRRFGDYDFSQLEVGGTFTDNGFVSTSLTVDGSKYNFSGTIGEIRAKKGSQGGFVGTSSLGRIEEAEIVLNRGQSFRIIDKYLDANNEMRVVMEVIQ